MKRDLLDIKEHGYRKCGKRCDWCNNFIDETSFVISKATGQKYQIRRNSTSANDIYFAYCTKCGEQGTGSLSCKPCLSNHKSLIKQYFFSCKTV